MAGIGRLIAHKLQERSVLMLYLNWHILLNMISYFFL